MYVCMYVFNHLRKEKSFLAICKFVKDPAAVASDSDNKWTAHSVHSDIGDSLTLSTLTQHSALTEKCCFLFKSVLFSKRPPARNPHWLIIKRAKLGGSPQQAGGDADQQAGGHADSCCCAGRPWGGLPQPPKTLKNPIFTIRATYQAHFKDTRNCQGQ